MFVSPKDHLIDIHIKCVFRATMLPAFPAIAKFAGGTNDPFDLWFNMGVSAA